MNRQQGLWDALEGRVASEGGLRNGRGGWLTTCPAHDDQSPSLSFYWAGDRISIRCFTGCPTDEVIAALPGDFTWQDRLPDATSTGRTSSWHPSSSLTSAPAPKGVLCDTPHVTDYDHPDVVYRCIDPEEQVFLHVRWDHACGHKTLHWRPRGPGAPDRFYVPRPLTHDSSRTLWVTEGEKPADALAAIDLDVIGYAGGAAARPSLAALRPHVRGYSHVRFWADADKPGAMLMNDIAVLLWDKANYRDTSTVSNEGWATGSDVADLLFPGLSARDLHALSMQGMSDDEMQLAYERMDDILKGNIRQNRRTTRR